jgi:hypothetical protein
MKKFFVLVFLVVLAGGAFFLGWAQLTVPPGSYGVMRSKTHGIDPRLIREGEFRWVWYKLLPTNAVITVFSLSPVDCPVEIHGTLPLADSYMSLAGIKADFSYEINGSISFTLKPDSLPSLVAGEALEDQNALDNFEERLAGKIKTFAVERLRAYAEDAEEIGDVLGFSSAPQLEEEILQEFPDIENLSCGFYGVRFPDFDLYRLLKTIYEDYLEQQRAILREDIAVSAGRHMASRLRFDELEKYGELLTRYPALLQYLALENGISQDPGAEN